MRNNPTADEFDALVLEVEKLKRELEIYRHSLTGARLNSSNQIKLYDGLIQDLGLKQGDLVIFVRNEVGHWEVRTEREIVQELDAVFDGKNVQNDKEAE